MPKKTAVLLAAVLSVFLPLCLFLPAPARAQATPGDSIDRFHAVLIANMKNGPKLQCSGRVETLSPAVDAGFDLPFLAQRVLRRHWQTLTDPQRALFIATFRELVVGTYASQFVAFDGERFETLGVTELKDGNRLVKTRLTPGSGAPVSLDYVLRNDAGNWRIVNVIAEGVSDLALRSTQYDRAFKAGGYDGLIAQLKLQIASNRRGC